MRSRKVLWGSTLLLGVILLLLPELTGATGYSKTMYTLTALRVREYPSTSAPILGTLAKGTRVSVDLDDATVTAGLTWVPGRTSDALEGWLAIDYLSTSRPAPPSAVSKTVPSSWRPTATKKERPDSGDSIIGWAVFLYMLPTLVALLRRHHNLLAIGFLNLLAGWTLLGWFISFIWALTAVRKPTHSRERQKFA